MWQFFGGVVTGSAAFLEACAVFLFCTTIFDATQTECVSFTLTPETPDSLKEKLSSNTVGLRQTLKTSRLPCDHLLKPLAY